VTRRRRRTAAALLAVAGSATVVVLMVAPASAQAPDVAAWWSAANVGNGAPPPPAPPDVPAGDLLVQGSNGNGAAPALPVSGAPATSQAVAGLSFDLPDGATVGALTLTIDGTAPPAPPTIVACKATQSFVAVENGAWTDVPPSDCSQTSTPKLDGSKLVFDDISKLVANGRLSVTILPGALDRVVLKKPDDSALTVMTAGGFGASAPPLGTGSNAGPITDASGGAPAPPVAAVGGGAVLPPAGTDGTSVAPPVIAPSAAPGQSATQPVAAASGSGTGGLSTTQRRVLAGIVIALELLGFAMLMGDRDGERLALGSVAAGAGAAVGGRLRAPDRGGRVPAAAPRAAGVGRFRSERHGPAPRL
jgi:hypothetical protein